MKWILLGVMMIALMASGPTMAGSQALSPALQKLDVSVGRWEFHGQTVNPPSGKNGHWTWNEDCHWSANRTFMLCSFNNDWAGIIVNSVVVDTYNRKDKSYWHYEIFDGGDSGARPFISRMTIDGNTRIEYAESVDHGQKSKPRVVYVFNSPRQVSVKIETSHDGAKWVTVDEGVGVKQP